MAFRADEAAQNGFEEVQRYLIPRVRGTDDPQTEKSKKALQDIVDELGPVVDGYPSWHPLVSNHDAHHPVRLPSPLCGYKGLDHTRYFANGFITCPYGDGQEVMDSVAALAQVHNSVAVLTAEKLDAQFYNSETTPILVKCEWLIPLSLEGMIPASIAIPMILEKEIPCWRWAQFAETWETMRPYFLGTPHGSRSSLFVSQETGQQIKKVWETLIYTGMFGPIKV